MTEQHFGTIEVFVVDEVGIVLSAQKVPGDQLSGPPPGGTAVANPETKSLFVGWIGGACHFGPTVTLTGGAYELVVTVRPEAGQGLPPGIACNDIGLFYGVNLALAVAVQPEAVDLQLVR